MLLANNSMFIILVWFFVLVICTLLSGLWVIYLIKLAVNEDEIQEKIRKHKRIAEEMLRSSNL